MSNRHIAGEFGVRFAKVKKFEGKKFFERGFLARIVLLNVLG